MSSAITPSATPSSTGSSRSPAHRALGRIDEMALRPDEGIAMGPERDKAAVRDRGRSMSSVPGQQTESPAVRAWQERVWPWRSAGAQG